MFLGEQVTLLQGWGYSFALVAFLGYQLLEMKERNAEARAVAASAPPPPLRAEDEE